MCAIAGLVGLDAEDTTLERMLKTMERRGPDDRGVSASPGCTLLHTPRQSFKGCKIKATIYDNACFSVKGRKIFFF